jgi:hypothetical protein
MAEQSPRYQLGPRSRRGLVAGWRGGQLALVGTGLVIAVAVLRAVGAAAGAFLGLGIVALFVALATWPFAGRSAEQWAPIVAAHARGRLGGRRRGALATLGVDEIPEPTAPRPVGVIVDGAAGTWTAAMRIGSSGFALGDEPERARRIAAWSGVLASSAREGGGLHRLQWVARCLPASFDDRSLPDGTAGRGIATDSYLSLLERAAPVLWRQEVLIALSVRGAPRPGRRRAPDAPRRLVDELAALGRRCTAAGLDVDGVLSPSELSEVIRSTVRAARAPEGLADVWPWPFSIAETWSSIRTDATWHAVYWIADWPRSGVGTGFLLPIMLEGGLRRTIAVTMAPLAPLRAVRRAEHDRTSVAADAELRQRHGFAVTARTRHEHEATSRRETELAEGHSAFRFTGYLAVTADDEEELAAACARLEQVAAQSQLELHRMYGAQQVGYGCILPTGRGCA